MLIKPGARLGRYESSPRSAPELWARSGAPAISPLDGRFLMVKSTGKAPAASLVVVLDWFPELRAKMSVD